MTSPLDDLLPRFDLERLRACFEERCLPAIGFDLFDRPVPSGGSRVGGRPELPRDFHWPAREADGGECPLDYLLQVRLSELPPSLLPSQGTLTFFYDRQDQPWGFEPDDRSGHRVIYTGKETERQPIARPGGTTAVPERSLEFRSTLTVPSAGSQEFETFVEAELDAEEQERYFEFEEALAMYGSTLDEGPHHRLLGYSENVQGDMQAEAQLVSNGISCADGVGWTHPRRASLEGGVDDWMLLLQLDSDDEAEFEWGDAGMLYFWIRKQDLAAAYFDRTWLILQSC